MAASSASAPSTEPATSADAIRQQERDDEAFARRLVMEEFAQYGGLANGAAAMNGFVGVHGRPEGARSRSSASAQPMMQKVRAPCPSCNTHNEFTALAGSTPTMRCGRCSHEFSVNVPEVARAGPPPIHLCRSCGAMNQYPQPMPGQPMPDVQCGQCSSVSTPSARGMSEFQVMSTNGLQRMGAGPLVRVNVGGQRRTIPLALLLSLMANEGEKSNAAQASDIAALPKRKLGGKETLGEQNRCMVCLEDFEEGDDVTTLPCLHLYHERCVDRWLQTDNSCPVCKHPIGRRG